MITLDMGGTSVDISIVDQAMPYSIENTVGEYPISMPAVDVSAIGARKDRWRGLTQKAC